MISSSQKLMKERITDLQNNPRDRIASTSQIEACKWLIRSQGRCLICSCIKQKKNQSIFQIKPRRSANGNPVELWLQMIVCCISIRLILAFSKGVHRYHASVNANEKRGFINHAKNRDKVVYWSSCPDQFGLEKAWNESPLVVDWWRQRNQWKLSVRLTGDR